MATILNVYEELIKKQNDWHFKKPKYNKWVKINKVEKSKELKEIFEKIEKHQHSWLKGFDIFKYKSIKELSEAIKQKEPNKLSESQLNRKMSKERKELRRLGLEQEAPIIYMEDDWVIYKAESMRAAQILGKNTTWCISSSSSGNQFKQYRKDGIVYIIHNRKNELEKYALVLERNEFKNKDNNEISDMVSLLFERSSMYEKFFRFIT